MSYTTLTGSSSAFSSSIAVPAIGAPITAQSVRHGFQTAIDNDKLLTSSIGAILSSTLTFKGQKTFDEAVELQKNLGIDGSAVINGTLGVSGSMALGGAGAFEGTLAVGDDLFVGGTTHLSGTLRHRGVVVQTGAANELGGGIINNMNLAASGAVISIIRFTKSTILRGIIPRHDGDRITLVCAYTDGFNPGLTVSSGSTTSDVANRFAYGSTLYDGQMMDAWYDGVQDRWVTSKIG